MTVRVRALAAVVAAAAAFALAGCSGGGDPDRPGPTVAPCPSTAPGVSPTSVRVGLLYSNSGASASAFTAFRSGVDARLAVTNAAGGIQGRRVTYTWADDQSAPLPNLSAARRLVEDHHDFAILEESAVPAGSAHYLRDAHVPVLGMPYEISWTQFRNMFSPPSYFAAGGAVSTVGDFVKGSGARRALLVASSTSDAARLARTQLTRSLTAAGVKVVGTLDASATRPDYPALGRLTRAAKADALVNAGSPEVFARTAVAAKQAGVRPRALVSPFGYDPSILRRYGHQLPGLAVYLSVMPFEAGLPAHRRYLSAMAEYAPQVQPPQSAVALDGWIAADMFLKGLSVSGRCPTRDGFTTALRGVHDYTAGGLLAAPLDFTADFGQVGRCYAFVQVSLTGKGWVARKPTPTCGRALPGAAGDD